MYHIFYHKRNGLYEWDNWHMQAWGFPLSRTNAYFGESGPCSMVLQSVSVVQEAGWARVVPRCCVPLEMNWHVKSAFATHRCSNKV